MSSSSNNDTCTTRGRTDDPRTNYTYLAVAGGKREATVDGSKPNMLHALNMVAVVPLKIVGGSPKTHP